MGREWYVFNQKTEAVFFPVSEKPVRIIPRHVCISRIEFHSRVLVLYIQGGPGRMQQL